MDAIDSTSSANAAPPPRTAAVVTCDPSGMYSSSKCPCRNGLTVLLPQVSDALREEKLDRVFKVTRDVMQAGQDIVDCTSCEIGCTDLICMMTIFRQTDSCFNFIAKADVDSSIIMDYGGFDLPVQSPQLRAMLVLNLVHHTFTILDAIGTKGHTMLEALNPPNDLATTNIAYLDTVIKDFRGLLTNVVESTSGTALDSQNMAGGY